MDNKELIRRALLGDKKSQEKCTAKGIAIPCPFCRSKATVQQDITGRKSYHVVCNNVKDMCNLIAGLPIWSESEEDALKVWNTRPAPPIGRCGECEHYNTKLHYCDILSQESDYRELHYVLMSPDDFCSCFEPREEE